MVQLRFAHDGYVAALTRLVLSDKPGLVCMIRVFMDESGVHDGTDYVSVSVVWAEDTQWPAWSNAWINALHPIKMYHASECNGLKGEFCGWNNADRDKLVMRLLTVIREHRIDARIAVIPRTALANALALRPDVRAGIGSDYGLCLNFALSSLKRNMAQININNYAVVHERCNYESEALLISKEVLGDVVSFTFGGKQQYVPLQCADLFAYEGYKQFDGRLHDNGKVRKPLSAIDCNSGRVQFVFYDDNDVAEKIAAPLIEWFDSRAQAH